MGFCMALNTNSAGIPGGFRGNTEFSGKLGVWGGFGRFGASKGFCTNSHSIGPALQTLRAPRESMVLCRASAASWKRRLKRP